MILKNIKPILSIILLVFICSNISYANNNLSNNLSNNFSGSVSLIRDFKTIGKADIKYESKTDQVILSKQAQKIILKSTLKNLKEKRVNKFKSELQKKLQANVNLDKPHLARKNNELAVYFSNKDLKLYIYIPYNYLKKDQINFEHDRFLPKIKNPNLSYANNINLDAYEISSDKFYNLETDGFISYSKNSLQYDVSNNTPNYVDDLYLEHIGKKYIYKAGYIIPLLQEGLMSTDSYWGVNIKSSPQLINPKFVSAYQIPLTIVLDKQYYVQILYRGTVLYQGTLSYGTNLIKTDNFPIGTYNITIQKRDLITGKKTTETQLFSKETSLYSWIYSGFEILGGLQYSKFEKPNFNRDNKLFKIKNGFQALNGDINLFYGYNNGKNFIGAEYDYISNNIFDYKLDLEASNKKDIFAMLSSFYNNKNTTYEISVSDTYKNQEISNKNTVQINFNLLTNIKNWDINLSALYNTHTYHTLSAIISRQFKYGSTIFNFSISGAHSKITGYQAALNLEILFSQEPLTTSLNVQQDLIAHSTIIQPYIKLGKDGNYISQQLTTTLNNTQIADDRPISGLTSAGLSNNYGSIIADMNSGYDTNTDKFSINSKHIGLRTAFIGTSKGSTFSNQQEGSGYLINLPKLKDDKLKFEIENNKYPNNRTIFVPIDPYQEKTLDIKYPDNKYKNSCKTDKQDLTHFFYPYNIKYISL